MAKSKRNKSNLGFSIRVHCKTSKECHGKIHDAVGPLKDHVMAFLQEREMPEEFIPLTLMWLIAALNEEAKLRYVLTGKQLPGINFREVPKKKKRRDHDGP